MNRAPPLSPIGMAAITEIRAEMIDLLLSVGDDRARRLAACRAQRRHAGEPWGAACGMSACPACARRSIHRWRRAMIDAASAGGMNVTELSAACRAGEVRSLARCLRRRRDRRGWSSVAFLGVVLSGRARVLVCHPPEVPRAAIINAMPSMTVIGDPAPFGRDIVPTMAELVALTKAGRFVGCRPLRFIIRQRELVADHRHRATAKLEMVPMPVVL